MFQHKLSRTRTDTSLSHFLSHKPLSRAIFQHKLSHTQLCHTLSYTHNFFHAPYFNTNDPCFVWEVWRFWLWALALCVVGVGLGDIDFAFEWQSWHLWHWAVSGRGTILLGRVCGALGPVSRPGHRQTLRGMRGTWWHRCSICVAGVVLGDIYLRLVWYAWHLGGSGGGLGRRVSRQT